MVTIFCIVLISILGISMVLAVMLASYGNSLSRKYRGRDITWGDLITDEEMDCRPK